MKVETSLKAGEFVRVPVGTLESGKWSGLRSNQHDDIARRVSEEANRAALPTTPKYPATPKALLAQLWEMGVRCDNCEYQVDETIPSGGCDTANKVLFCAHWDAK